MGELPRPPVGLYKLSAAPTALKSRLVSGFIPRTYEVKARFQTLLSNTTCAATPRLAQGPFTEEEDEVGVDELNPVDP
jgi:hypothetical protein